VFGQTLLVIEGSGNNSEPDHTNATVLSAYDEPVRTHNATNIHKNVTLTDNTPKLLKLGVFQAQFLP